MGFVEAVREIIEKLRKTGKTKEEIFEVVKEAADKATIKAEDKGKEERAKQKSRIDGIDAMTYALQKAGIAVQDAMRAIGRMNKVYCRKSTNNWRKMHGLPMRRKSGRRKRSGKGKRADSHRKDTDLS